MICAHDRAYSLLSHTKPETIFIGPCIGWNKNEDKFVRFNSASFSVAFSMHNGYLYGVKVGA